MGCHNRKIRKRIREIITMKKLTVTLITLNEEENIKKCLDSVKPIADEIVVVDSGSADDTVKIAKQYTSKVYTRKFDNYASQKNYAAEKANGDWIFSIDADEVVSPELQHQIVDAIVSDKYSGYLIPRNNIILGKHIKHTRWSPDVHVWLWKKEQGKWVGEVHEELIVQGKIGKLTAAKIHYQDKTVAEFFQTINNYTEREAQEKMKNGVNFSYFRLFFDPALSFFRRFVYKKGFLDGWRGFVLSYMMAVYRMTTWIKVWEYETNHK